MGKVLYQKNAQWDKSDFGQAMVNAVYRHAQPKYIRHVGDKLTFNGFWRDGKKRNVCIWPDQAAWSDLRDSENGYSNKGGVKSFAKTVLNMNLPEFMNQYGNGQRVSLVKEQRQKSFSPDYVNAIWEELLKRDQGRANPALHWLAHTRKFRSHALSTTLSFANLYGEEVDLFAREHRPLIQHRLNLGQNIVVPLRGIDDDKVENLYLRALDNIDKEDKARLLTNCGGWHSRNDAPRAFGFPYLIHDFPNVVICEGMADYFAAECLLDADEKYLPIGAPGTAAINKWGEWLSQAKYSGRIHLIYQLDPDQSNSLSTYGAGQKAAVNARRTLSNAGQIVNLFNWTFFLRLTTGWHKAPRDLADVFICTDGPEDLLSEAFLNTLKNG